MDIIEKLKKLYADENFARCGMIGSIALLIALFIPQIGYKGHDGDYSMINHFVSELGWFEVNHLAIVFSIGLIVGGFFYIFFIIGLGAQFEGFMAKIATALGLISAIGCILVGVFPVDVDLELHGLAAVTFFIGAFFTIIAIAIVVLLDKEKLVPKYSLIGCFIVIAIYLWLFTLDLPGQTELHVDVEKRRIVDRPDVWMVAIAEWAAVLSVVASLLLIALYFELKMKKS